MYSSQTTQKQVCVVVTLALIPNGKAIITNAEVIIPNAKASTETISLTYLVPRLHS